MRMMFDFEGDEVLAVMRLITERLEVLGKQPDSPALREEVSILYGFLKKMGPVIEVGSLVESIEFKARMN